MNIIIGLIKVFVDILNELQKKEKRSLSKYAYTAKKGEGSGLDMDLVFALHYDLLTKLLIQ